MSRIVCISNRVSLPDPETGEVKAGGLAVGVKASMESNGGGVWFGWNGEVLDTTHGGRKLQKTDSENITFLTLPLTKAEYEGYYKSMANENLWPLMHELEGHIDGKARSYQTYKRVNRVFAKMIQPHLRPDDVIWVHDYHLMALGRELRSLGVHNKMGYYHHIPMCSPDIFQRPGVPDYLKNQFITLLSDLFYFDLVGLQSFRDFKNMTGFLRQSVDPAPRFETRPVKHAGRKIEMGVFPISIETADLLHCSRDKDVKTKAGQSSGVKTLIGAERLDYTKGLINRLKGYDCFLKSYPELHKKVHYQQITPLSRADIDEYKETIDNVREMVAHIQDTYGDQAWSPLNYSEDFVPREILMDKFRAADVGLVTPLIDGQNLVAKEFLAVQDPVDPDVLILSRYAGAAEEFSEYGVLCVEPDNPQDIAEKIYQALHMSREVRVKNHKAVLSHLMKYDIEHWAESFLDQLSHSHLKSDAIKAPVSVSDSGKSSAAAA